MALSCKLFGLQKEDYRSDLLQYEQALQNYMALLDFVFEEMEVSQEWLFHDLLKTDFGLTWRTCGNRERRLGLYRAL